MEALNFIGFLLPPIIDLINRKIASSDIRFWVSVLFCAFVGLFVAWTQGILGDVNAVLNLIFAVIGSAQITYKGVYEQSKLQTTIRS